MGETWAYWAAAFVFGWLIPTTALVSLVRGQKETNALLRHIVRQGPDVVGAPD